MVNGPPTRSFRVAYDLRSAYTGGDSKQRQPDRLLRKSSECHVLMHCQLVYADARLAQVLKMTARDSRRNDTARSLWYAAVFDFDV
jgi:hypothetical protein